MIRKRYLQRPETGFAVDTCPYFSIENGVRCLALARGRSKIVGMSE